MMLSVTLRKPLTDRYGTDGYDSIRAALSAYSKAAGAELFALDDPADMGELNLFVAPSNEPGTLMASVRAVRKKLGPVDSLLIVGGHGIFPHWTMANPVTDRGIDPDDTVLSDNPYGTDEDTLQQYLAPPLPVGRLTDLPRGSADDFVQLINAATESRKQRKPHSKALAVVNADWSDYSHSATSALPVAIDWELSPGYLLDRNRQADADREFLYFNLHGFDGAAEWKGYDSVQERFVTAVTPDAFNRQYVSGSIAFAENCYGAQTAGRTPSNSCALRLVSEGAAFVGATGLAFGSHLAPKFFLDDADALAQSFWSQLASGAELGQALCRARSMYFADESNTPSTNQFKQKTLLQFILLGDPGWN